MIIKSENVDLLNLESKEDGEGNSHMWEEKIVDNEFEQEQLELLEEKINLKILHNFLMVTTKML